MTTTKRSVPDLLQGPIVPSVIRFAVPLLLASLVQLLYNSVNTLFVGRFLGTAPQAAVGAGSLFVTCLVGLLVGISAGVSVVVSGSFGSGDRETLHRAVQTASFLALVGALVLTVFGFFFTPVYLKLVHTPADIAKAAASYLRIYALSIPAIVFYNIGAGILRAVGDSRRPLLVQVAGGALNVLLNGLLLGVLHTDADGSALSTLCAQYLSAGLTIWFLAGRRDFFGFYVRRFHLFASEAKRIVLIGVPAGLQTMAVTLSNILVQAQINAFGTTSIAAFTAYFQIELLIYYPILAFAQAAAVFTGQNLGAGDVPRTRRGIRACLGLSVLVSAVLSALLLLGGTPMFRFFNPDPAVVELGKRLIAVSFPFYFICSFHYILGDSIRAMGRSVAPMLIVIGNICVLRVVLLNVWLRYQHDLRVIAGVYPISWAAASLCMAVCYAILMRRRNTL